MTKYPYSQFSELLKDLDEEHLIKKVEKFKKRWIPKFADLLDEDGPREIFVERCGVRLGMRFPEEVIGNMIDSIAYDYLNAISMVFADIEDKDSLICDYEKMEKHIEGFRSLVLKNSNHIMMSYIREQGDKSVGIWESVAKNHKDNLYKDGKEIQGAIRILDDILVTPDILIKWAGASKKYWNNVKVENQRKNLKCYAPLIQGLLKLHFTVSGSVPRNISQTAIDRYMDIDNEKIWFYLCVKDALNNLMDARYRARDAELSDKTIFGYLRAEKNKIDWSSGPNSNCKDERLITPMVVIEECWDDYFSQ